jgi:hypothetical protein
MQIPLPDADSSASGVAVAARVARPLCVVHSYDLAARLKCPSAL